MTRETPGRSTGLAGSTWRPHPTLNASSTDITLPPLSHETLALFNRPRYDDVGRRVPTLRVSERPKMRQTIPRILAVCAAVAWAVLWWLTDWGTDASSSRQPGVPTRGTEKHYVTPAQLVESGARADGKARSFSAVAHDGTVFSWSEMSGPRPLVLVFVRRDCPCSVEFEPFFHRLAGRYRDVAEFAGVIDAGADAALAYATANKSPYRILADPDRAIIDRFEAKNGGYVALLRPDGAIDTLWPGYSAEMMRELGRRIAKLGAAAERSIDVDGMPGALTTGCPYEP
jgi:peroxiredoxin